MDIGWGKISQFPPGWQMTNAQKALKSSEQLTDDLWMGDQKAFCGGEGVRVVDLRV